MLSQQILIVGVFMHPIAEFPISNGSKSKLIQKQYIFIKHKIHFEQIKIIINLLKNKCTNGLNEK